jgi:hypothetical protein
MTRQARPAQACGPPPAHHPRQKRTFTPSGAVHKYTARPTVRRAGTGECYADNDATGS